METGARFEPVTEAPTPFGPVHFRGPDTGKPVLLMITGAFNGDDLLIGLWHHAPEFDVLRAHLPGNHCPPLVETTMGVFIAAFDFAIRTAFRDRPVLVLGLSTGALVALGLKSREVRRLLLVEPPLRTHELWPLRHFPRGPAEAEFMWNIFGVGDEIVEPRDYTHLLDGLTVRALTLVGAAPLLPEREPLPMPSLVDNESRRRLFAHPLMNVWTIDGAGHNIPLEATDGLLRAVDASCRALLAEVGHQDKPPPS